MFSSIGYYNIQPGFSRNYIFAPGHAIHPPLKNIARCISLHIDPWPEPASFFFISLFQEAYLVYLLCHRLQSANSPVLETRNFTLLSTSGMLTNHGLSAGYQRTSLLRIELGHLLLLVPNSVISSLSPTSLLLLVTPIHTLGRLLSIHLCKHGPFRPRSLHQY